MSQDLKTKQILDLINQGTVTLEHALEMLKMSEPKSIILGKDVSHTYTEKDATGRCQTCFGTNVSIIGKLSIEGTEQDVKKCNHCNKIFSGADGGIRSLLDEAAKVYRTDKVGFTYLGNNQSAINLHTPVVTQDYTMHTHLSAINNATNDMSRQMNNLINTIENLITQNNTLMEKLATDQLIGIKKAVNNFNLE